MIFTDKQLADAFDAMIYKERPQYPMALTAPHIHMDFAFQMFKAGAQWACEQREKKPAS